jgi:hypothetical protein
MAAFTRFGAQELESGAISPSLVEQQLEGDKVADLMSSQPCGQDPALDSASSFNFSSSLLSWFSSPMEAILIFVLTTVVAGKEAYHPLSPHVQSPK